MGQAAGSITRLIPEVLRRDPLAVEQLWERYVARIEGVARPLVAALPPGAGDEQDVAQSAFHAFCLAAANGQAPRLTDRNELWRLLSTIARHKAVDRVRRELRDCRGGGAQPSPQGLSHAPSGDPTPSQAVALQETLDDLLQALDQHDDPRLRAIAQWRLEGASVDEIAARLDCTERTVQRKLQILERLWTSLAQ